MFHLSVEKRNTLDYALDHTDWHGARAARDPAAITAFIPFKEPVYGAQRELGKLCGMAQSTLARLETGQLSEFGSRKLLRLLEVLGAGLSVSPLRGSGVSFTLDDALAERRAQVEFEAQHPMTQRARG